MNVNVNLGKKNTTITVEIPNKTFDKKMIPMVLQLLQGFKIEKKPCGCNDAEAEQPEPESEHHYNRFYDAFKIDENNVGDIKIGDFVGIGKRMITHKVLEDTPDTLKIAEYIDFDAENAEIIHRTQLLKNDEYDKQNYFFKSKEKGFKDFVHGK